MSKDKLVQAVKSIIALAKAGKTDESYAGYFALFSDPEFVKARPEDQRNALKLMVHAKGIRNPSQQVIDAHRAAVLPLTELVSLHDEPADYEMLGMCHLLIGNAESASRMFRAGLAIERERCPQSELCGALMRRIADI